MDGLFENLFEGFPKWVFGSSVEFPAINVWEDSDNVFVEAELPGLKLDDIELLIMGDEQLDRKPYTCLPTHVRLTGKCLQNRSYHALPPENKSISHIKLCRYFGTHPALY